MKKLITILFFVFSFEAHSQIALFPFPQPGMGQVEIYHGDFTTGWYPFNNSFQYVSDTIVGGNKFAKYTGKHLINNVYTFYDSGKIYYHYSTTLNNPYSGRLLYDFSMNIGDSILLSSYLYPGYWKVDSIAPKLLSNGQPRKYMRLKSGGSKLEWIDGIGDITHGFLYEGDFEGGYEEFVCNKDASGFVYGNPTTTYFCNMNNPVILGDSVNCGIFNYDAQVTPAGCGLCNGAISITNITGGAGNYVFNWSGNPFGNGTPHVSNLCFAMTYTLTVKDKNNVNCSHIFYVPTNPSFITVIGTSKNISCNGSMDGSVCITATGGTPIYTYNWSPGGWTTACLTGLSFEGDYTACVTDVNGCASCTTFNIKEPAVLNSVAQVTNTSCSSCYDGNIQLNITGGTPPYEITYVPNVLPLPGNFWAGKYYYCITDSVGCTFCDSATVLSNTSQGIQTILNTDNITIDPNPAKDHIVIKSDLINENIELELFNYQGALVKKIKLVKTTTIIDISDLEEGLYFIKTAIPSSSAKKILIIK